MPDAPAGARRVHVERHLRFDAPGEPIPQPRPRARAVTGKGRAFAHVYHAPGPIDGWRRAIRVAAAAAWDGQAFRGGVVAVLAFRFARPQRLLRKKDPAGPILRVSDPDADNLAKPVLDALTETGVWADDGQVGGLVVLKHYVAKGAEPGVSALIVEVDPYDAVEGLVERLRRGVQAVRGAEAGGPADARTL